MQLGEVDAGVVYVTDVQAAGDKVKGVEIPADVNASTTYPIAALTKSANAATAAAFVDYVLSPAGTTVLDGGRVRAAVTAPAGRPRAAPALVVLDTEPARAGAPGHRWRSGAVGPGRPAGARGWSRSAFLVSRWSALLRPGAVGRCLVDPARARRRARRSCSRCGPRRWPRSSRSWSACRWPGCWRAPTFPGLRLLRALVTLPLVLPPVVGGVALLLAFGRNGFVGQYLDQWFGITIPFTPPAVVMAETFVAMPFLDHHGRGRAALGRPWLRGGRGHPGRVRG